MRRFNRAVQLAAAANTRGARAQARRAQVELASLRVGFAGLLANYDLYHERDPARFAEQIGHLRRDIFGARR